MIGADIDDDALSTTQRPFYSFELNKNDEQNELNKKRYPQEGWAIPIIKDLSGAECFEADEPVPIVLYSGGYTPRDWRLDQDNGLTIRLSPLETKKHDHRRPERVSRPLLFNRHLKTRKQIFRKRPGHARLPLS